LGLPAGAAAWPKDQHLEQIGTSGRFRYRRELVAHAWFETDAERLIGLAESIGGPREIFGEAAPEVETTFNDLRRVAGRVLGDGTWRALFGYRLRVGVK
jgi:hypothetical protein